MKSILTRLLFGILLLSLPLLTLAQITNGNFESQNTAPEGQNNVAGPLQSYNDLPAWQTLTGQKYGTANYMATNAVDPVMNPQSPPSAVPRGYPYFGAFSPHAGIGCVAIVREPGVVDNDQFITQAVSGLIPGNTYQANFYVLRRPGSQVKERISLYVTNSIPTVNLNYSTRSFSPAAYATITSNPISDDQNWTLVSGTFVANSSTAAITIGYDETFGQLDSSLDSYYSPPGGGPDYYAIDDVSLTNLGCMAPVDVSLLEHSQTVQCFENDEYFHIINFNSTYHYTINHPGSGAIPANPTTPDFKIKWMAGANGATFSITVTNNTCGNSTTSGPFYANNDGCTGNLQSAPVTSFTAYPNPATESLTMPTGTERATLFNTQGQLIELNPDASGKFNIKELPNGLYNLQMRQDGKLINQRIEIKH